MKKVSVLVAILLVATLFIGCAGKTEKAEFSIGIIQLVEHTALDASYQGFVDGLKEAGYEDGKNLVIDYENAQGDQSNCSTIAQKMVNDNNDLILAIATPAAQAVANLTQTIPVLVTAVTDPANARLVETNEHPGTNVSGTSDLNPVEAQISLIKEMVPTAKKIAFLYCSSEENSIFQVNLAKKAADKAGLEYVDATVSNSNEIQQVVQSLVGKVDAIYTPTDNMIAAGMVTVTMVTIPAKLPVFCGEENMVKAGGLATYSLNYYELGKQTAKMAVDVLENGANPAEMPIQYLETCDLVINFETADAIGLTVSDELKAKNVEK